MVRNGAFALFAALCMVLLGLASAPKAALAEQSDGLVAAQSAEVSAQADELSYDAELTFSDSAITETASGSGYSISGTALEISAAGTYRVTGSCSEGSIVVKKNVSGVVLVLDNLTLTSSSTAPLVVKKTETATADATTTVHLIGTSTLTDKEDPANETSTDSTVADAFEGACVKVKSGSNVTFCGSGNLNVVANAKNGIKGGSTSALVFNQSGTITVSGSGKYYGTTKSGAAVNNGIASDGSVTFNQGTYSIKAAGDGIKSTPDATDEDEGTTIDEDSAGAIYVYGGTFDIDVDGDGIQADTALTIASGTFDIQTWKGSSTWSDTLADQYSCKGLKAAGDRAEEAGLSPTITVTGGDFTLNCGDDAVHSDAYATVTGGTFDINTGDDGMHADTTLTLGTSGGYERDPDVKISSSYEGLEAGTVYVYSGRFYVCATDDGVNAAGGSTSGTDTGGTDSDGFTPGGGGPGSGGGGPGSSGSSGSSDYNLYFYGGELYVNCDGDGLDSNGGLYLYGGKQAVFSQGGNGDNSAIDCDGTVLIDGATIITAGLAGMDGSAQSGWFGSNQKYKAASSSYSANTVLNAKASSTIMMSYKLPKKVSYVMASWPSSVSSTAPTFATASSLTSCKSSSWEHSWNSGSTVSGVTTYTCSSCGATEKQTVATSATVADCSHTASAAASPTEYTATFSIVDGDGAASSNATINTYYTQDYTTASETNVTTAVARDSDTGDVDVSGSGQINFTVVPADGYTVDDVAVTGSYNKLKDISSDAGVANTYRITKVASDLTVTVTVSSCAHANVSEPTWTWADGYSSATASFYCSDCGSTVEVDGTVTSTLSDDASTITFTATATIGGNEYTDTKTADPFTATFSMGEGVDSVDVYYTQDYSTADETGATSAVARDGDTGYPVVSGSGQINFCVNLKDGYAISSVTATEGTYKNIKGPSDTGKANTYRITKVEKDTVITIATAQCSHANVGDPGWSWADDYSSAVAAFECSDCGCTVYVDGDISTSVVDTDDEAAVVYTATATLNSTEYTDSKTVNAFKATFEVENATINVYNAQDYTTVSTEGATSAYARDKQGVLDVSGDGQVNFTVVPSSGYTVSSVTATEGTYKNIKDISSDAGVENTYRVTKITGDTTITVTTEADESGSSGSDSGNSGSSSSSGSSNSTVTPATSVEAGSSLESVDAFLTSRTDDSDPAGSEFSKLRLKVAKVKKKVEKLTWTKVSGATKYVVYGNKCGKKNKLVKIATVTGKSYKATKLKKGTYYKYMVVAVDASNKVVSASKVVHVATKGGKVTNVKKVKLTNKKTGKTAKKVTLATGKTVKLKASVTKVAKELKLKTHRKVKWESSDTSVATVSASGKVKAVGSGTCYVYAYAQNGVFAKCKVTVK